MRRILPALLATCLVTAIVAVTLFRPTSRLTSGNTPRRDPGTRWSNVALLTEGWVPNQTSGNPLTHLWSISVEEQFI
jgi:peptidoglycan/LPS O-acetylase OafA/YrhL